LLPVEIHTDDYIHFLTEPEKEALRQFRKHEITEGHSDRKLMVFLFSKKLEVDRAVQLLQNNMTVRKEFNIPENVTAHDVHPQLLKSASNFTIVGKRDKSGRGISYLIPSNVVPSQFTLPEYFIYMFYMLDDSQWESPDFHRNGFVLIEDLSHCGLKNFDMRPTSHFRGKKMDMQDLFPGRIQAIYILNPPFQLLFRALLKIAKLVVKQKLLKRVQLLSKNEDLLNYIEADQLWDKFGGSLVYNHEEHIAEQLKKS